MRWTPALALLLVACGGAEREPVPRLVGQPTSGVGVTTELVDCDTQCGFAVCDPPPKGCTQLDPWTRLEVFGSTLTYDLGRYCAPHRTFKIFFVTGG